MLEGKRTNLRVAETGDIPRLAAWSGDPQFAGAHQHFPVQVPSVHIEERVRRHELYHSEWVDFIVEDKSGAAVGWAAHYISAPNFGWTEIGFAVVPSERNRGYASEAASMLTDYLFLTKDVPRVQALADADNLASVRVLEKSGFRKEGVMRKSLWNGEGIWADGLLYAILRDEWGSPRILSGRG
jgi:RimJ/RimL family protein N-acetyltransferase